jgi:hypothetical protein
MPRLREFVPDVGRKLVDQESEEKRFKKHNEAIYE